MLSVAWRAGGPGPQTLAYRISLSCIGAARTSHAKSIPKQLDRSYATPAVARTTTRAKAAPIRAPKFPIDPGKNLDKPSVKVIIARLLLSCRRREHDRVIEVWKQLQTEKAITKLSKVDFGHISKYVRGLSESLKAGGLFNQPRYWVIRDMAIEAAARDCWQGLHQLSLLAFKAGRPQEVANAFEEYKLKIFAVQGKDRAETRSRDRQLRMKARLEGYGPKPLTYLYLLSMTLLNQVDGKLLMSVLETAVPIYNSSPTMINAIMVDILPSFPPARRSIIRRDFEETIDKAVFVLQAWHAKALLRWLREYRSNQDWPALREMYRQFLRYSIGPGKFVHASMLDDREAQVEGQVAFPADLWLQFILGFKQSGDLQALIDMLQKDLPERQLRPTPYILSNMISALAHLSVREDLPRYVREQARRAVERLWSNVIQRGEPLTDRLIAVRIDAMAKFDSESVPLLHAEISRGLHPTAGINTMTRLVGWYIARGQPDVALEMIKEGLEGKGICKPDKQVFDYAIRSARSKGSVGREVVLKLLEIKPANVSLSPSGIGHTLGHLLAWGMDTDVVVSHFVDAVVKHPQYNTIDNWMLCVSAVLNRDGMNEAEFITSLKIAKLLESVPPSNASPTSSRLLWARLFTRLLSCDLPENTRLTLLDGCLGLFPPVNKLHLGRIPIISIVKHAMSRPDQDRSTDIYRILDWYCERHRTQPNQCRWTIFEAFIVALQHREYAIALNLLQYPAFCKEADYAKARSLVASLTKSSQVSPVMLAKLRLTIMGTPIPDLDLEDDDKGEKAREVIPADIVTEHAVDADLEDGMDDTWSA